MRNKKGFTLIELLAVILILGIIALIAIPTITGVIKESRRGAWEATGNALVKAVETDVQLCELNSEGASTSMAVCPAGFEYITDTNKDYNKLGVKGKMPATVELLELVVDNTNGDRVVISFKGDNNIQCTNLAAYSDTAPANTSTVKDKVVCE